MITIALTMAAVTFVTFSFQMLCYMKHRHNHSHVSSSGNRARLEACFQH
jgi:hypothetical protein